jgi:hypothetical protein
LPEAPGRVWQIVQDKRLPLRDGHNIENYVNDPSVTLADQLITEILFPDRDSVSRCLKRRPLQNPKHQDRRRSFISRGTAGPGRDLGPKSYLSR